MITSSANQNIKSSVKSSNNGFIPSFDKLKYRTKKTDKIYYRNVTDPKSGELRRIANRLKPKPLFTRTTREIYGYYCRLEKMNNGFLCPGYKSIMEKCECSKASVTAANDILTEYNLIGIQRTGRSNTIIIVPLDDDGFPIESSAEYEIAKALNEKYRIQKIRPQIPTFQESEANKVDRAYNNKRQFKREFKKSESPPAKPKFSPPKNIPLNEKRANADDIKKIRTALTDQYSPSISNQIIKRGLLAYGLAFMLWLAVRCQRQDVRSPVKFFCDGINKREIYNEYDRKIVREGEAEAIKENVDHKKDIKEMAELIKNMNFLKDINGKK